MRITLVKTGSPCDETRGRVRISRLRSHLKSQCFQLKKGQGKRGNLLVKNRRLSMFYRIAQWHGPSLDENVKKLALVCKRLITFDQMPHDIAQPGNMVFDLEHRAAPRQAQR